MSEVAAVEDTRRPAYGPGRVLIAVYAVFAISASARSGVQLIRDAGQAPLAYGLSAFAAAVYLVATIALAHNGRRWRIVGWVAVIIEAVGVLTVGTLSLAQPELFGRDTVWSMFGAGYAYIPLVLPALGLAWLWWSRPSRLAGE